MEKFLSIIFKMLVSLFYTNASITIPIVVSLIAIIISIHTAIKQNKIALFELRYGCYSQLQKITNFGRGVFGTNDTDVILKLFDAIWGSTVAESNGDKILIKATTQLGIIEHIVLQKEFLFAYKFSVDLSDLIKCLQDVITAASAEIVNTEAIEELHRLCDILSEKDLHNIRKILKI